MGQEPPSIKISVIPTIRDFPWGATGHCMGALVEELLEGGHEVQWFVAPVDIHHPEVARIKKLGAKVEKLPEPPPRFISLKKIRSFLWRKLHVSQSLQEKVESFRPNHIYLNQGGTFCGTMPEFREVLQRHPRQYSLICHLFNPRVPTGGVAKAEADALIRNAHTVFFNSRWSRQGGESAIGRPIPQGKYYHYPHRYTFEHPLAWPESARPRLALVGRLDTEHKGIDLGLAALGRLRQEGFDFLFTLYGMGPDESFLRETVKKLGLEDKVSFAGYAEDVRKVWQENEILLLPSRREGCAVAMTEAMGFGRPVIATAVGGAPDWIEPGKEGFLCAAPEAELLAETLRSALQERPRWPEMGRRAHEKVKACLDPNPARVFLESLR